MSKKSSTLVVATKRPGACKDCRHVNQGTVDFAENRLLCWMDKRTKKPGQTCDVTLPLPRAKATPAAALQRYYLYEPFEGDNGTYGVSEDLRVLAEDADDGLRKSLAADRPFIPATGR